MTGWTTRAARLAPPATRGMRFQMRMAGQSPATTGDLARTPAWWGWDEPAQHRIGLVAVLGQHGRALCRETRGAVLAPLAALIGDDLLDRLRHADDAPSDDAPIPSPAALNDAAQTLLREAMAGDRSAMTAIERAAGLARGQA